MHDGGVQDPIKHPEREDPQVRVFHSFEDENEAEHQRRAAMTHDERMREFAVLRARRWGRDWGRLPIERQASWEQVSWWESPMQFSDDMKALIRLFERHGVRYVLVGGHAVN